MPATAKKNVGAKRAQTLVDDLVSGLQQPIPIQGQPLIVENRIAQTKSAHVVVIWDAWNRLAPTDRSKVILDAYAKARRLRGATITVAMGLTGEEAMRQGFLPYSIVTTRREADKVSLAQLLKAMAGAGGVPVKVGASTHLRFPTLEQAEDAYRQLSQKVSGPYWAIVHEQPTTD